MSQMLNVSYEGYSHKLLITSVTPLFQRSSSGSFLILKWLLFILILINGNSYCKMQAFYFTRAGNKVNPFMHNVAKWPNIR